MRRLAYFLAASVAAVSAVGLWAQEADSVVPAISPPAASQPVPRLIMLSGTVKDLTGKPLTGPVDLNFAIYKEQADAAPLWQESQTLNVDEQGHYTVLLGAMQQEGLPTELFTTGEARWLGVSVGRLPEQPRVLLVSVPYALKANDSEMLGGKPASAYALAQPAGASTSPGTAPAGATGPREAATPDVAAPGKPTSGPKPNVAGIGTKNYIPMWTDSAGTLGNSMVYQTGGLLGIGTTTPVSAVDILGANAGLRLRGTGTHEVIVTGVTSGRLGQDAAGFFFASDTNGGAIRFGTNNGASNEWMRITSGGNIGIATTAPAHTLDVAGDINASTNIIAGGNLSVTGTISGNGAGLTALNASNLASGTVPSAVLSGTYSNALTFSSASNNLAGNGAGLTALNASNLASGTVPSARISGTYGNALTFSSASNSFTGNGAGLTNVAATTAATATTASGLSCTGCVGNTQLGVNYAGSTSQGGAAANALLLNGNASSAFQTAGSYAVTTGPNSFTGNQTVTGGSVGIGTTGPVSALNVAGTTGLTWTFGTGVNNLGLATFGTPGTGGSLYINTPSGSSTYQSGLGIDGTYGTPSQQSVINIKALGVKSGGGYGSQLAFWTTSGTALNQQMTIDMNGNVGIGTTTPAHVLDVVGDINASTNINAGGNLSVTGTITGNGSGLTGVSTSGLAAGTYSNAYTFNNAGNSFSGSGAGLTNVNAATLGGFASSAFQPAGSYAVTTGPNSFTGTQTFAGTETVDGPLNVGSSGQYQVNSSGVVAKYNGQATAGTGLGAVVGVVDTLNQTASISSTTFATPSGTGLYHLMAVLFVTTDPSGCSPNPSGHLQIIANTDSTDQLFYTSPTLSWPLSPVSVLNVPIEVKGGTNVQYNVTWTAGTGCTTAGDYGLRIRLMAY